MTDELTVAASVAVTLHQELEDDVVGLWKLPWHIRRALPTASDPQVQKIALSVLDALVTRGVAIGSLDEVTGVFEPWPGAGATGSVIGAWRELGRDPRIGEIAWLASTT